MSATANVIFCQQLEVIESVVLVFERVVFLNIEKKRKTFGVSGTKSGKWLLKILRVLWYFYFATYVQFLVSSITKQVAGMERVTHRILSQTLPPLSLSLHVTEDNRKLQCTNFYNVI